MRRSRANRDKVSLLLALGWSNVRIANAVGISAPTLRKCYRAELKTASSPVTVWTHAGRREAVRGR